MPAVSCFDDNQDVGPKARIVPGTNGLGITGAGFSASLHCPLPLNNVDLGRTTNDNDISSYTVLYSDADARGTGAHMVVTLQETTVVNGCFQFRDLCAWDSNIHGALSSAPSASTNPCVVDLVATGIYSFWVTMRSSADFRDQNGGQVPALVFLGIRFP